MHFCGCGLDLLPFWVKKALYLSYLFKIILEFFLLLILFGLVLYIVWSQLVTHDRYPIGVVTQKWLHGISNIIKNHNITNTHQQFSFHWHSHWKYVRMSILWRLLIQTKIFWISFDIILWTIIILSLRCISSNCIVFYALAG